MKVLLVSADPSVRDSVAVALRSLERAADEPVEFIEASDGVAGMKLAWRHRPEIVVADEITSRAGAFALTRDLKGSLPPLPALVVILLEREQDEWLARWSGADAWFVKPVNPFELAETVTGSLERVREEAV